MARRQSNVGSTAPIYEDFQPKSEQKEEQGAHVLYLHLPDFSKEQIRVSYIDSTRTVRIQGERPLEKNKRSRFNRTFLVPENCFVDKIQGRFQEGILTIIIPKQTIGPPQPTATPKHEGTKITPKEKEPSSALAPPPTKPSSVTAPPPKVPSPVAAPPPKEPSPAETPPPKVPSSVVAPPPKEPSLAVAPPLPPAKIPSSVAVPPSKPVAPVQLPQGETIGKDQQSSPAFQAPQKPMIELKVRKGQEQGDTSAKATLKQSTEKEKEDSQTMDKEKKVDAPSKAPYESKPQKQDKTPSPFETKEKTEERRSAESKIESIKKSDETATKIAARNGPEKEGDVVGEKDKVKEETSFLEKAKEMKNVALAMMKTALEKKEDRHLIVNVGVAVLVIVAVGAYVTYKIRSSANAKD